MPVLILDTNSFDQNWLCTGLKFDLLRHNRFYPPLSTLVPAVVFEELVANHGREVEKVVTASTELTRKARRLVISDRPPMDVPTFDYRQYLLERFDEVLSISVLDWPTTPHFELVGRAVARTPPFNNTGGGYRDALVWSDVVAQAASGSEVFLASRDKAFGLDGALHPMLDAEVGGLPGTVTLVQDLGAWFLGRLPWKPDGLRDAVDVSRDEEFAEWFMASDFQDSVAPAAEDLSLQAPVLSLKVETVEWDGYMQRVGEREAAPDLVVVEYDIGQTVGFVVELPTGAAVEPSWDRTWSGEPRRLFAGGSIPMILRVAVGFGDDDWGIDVIAWRRADGLGLGYGLLETDPNQGLLF